MVAHAKRGKTREMQVMIDFGLTSDAALYGANSQKTNLKNARL